jgi:hypothetical protein
VAAPAGTEVPGGGGAADCRARQGRLHAGGRHVVERVKLLGAAAPVIDVGLVPQLPQPALYGLGPIARHAVLDQRAHQPAPLVVVLRGHRPQTGLVRAPLGGARLEGEAPLRVLGHERARRERELDQRAVARLDDRVVDLVGDGEVVEGPAGCVLVIDVARAPVRQRPPDAAVEDVVRAHVVRLLGEGADGLEMSLAGRRRRPVDLVEAETRPDAAQRSPRHAAVHAHRGLGTVRLLSQRPSPVHAARRTLPPLTPGGSCC